MNTGEHQAIFEYENDLRLPALALKEIFESLGDVPPSAALCGKPGLSPLDCERLAKMESSRKHWAGALKWVEKGLTIESFDPRRGRRKHPALPLGHEKENQFRRIQQRFEPSEDE